MDKKMGNHNDDGQYQNKSYRSALKNLYGQDDDFIIIGLTGRTGSGCSTVKNILTADKSDILD